MKLTTILNFRRKRDSYSLSQILYRRKAIAPEDVVLQNYSRVRQIRQADENFSIKKYLFNGISRGICNRGQKKEHRTGSYQRGYVRFRQRSHKYRVVVSQDHLNALADSLKRETGNLEAIIHHHFSPSCALFSPLWRTHNRWLLARHVPRNWITVAEIRFSNRLLAVESTKSFNLFQSGPKKSSDKFFGLRLSEYCSQHDVNFPFN